MDRKKAKGIDGVSKEDYTEKLEENITNLVKRMKSGSYKPMLQEELIFLKMEATR
ncbi:hypothetical protein [uncultured Clostridium sp.]|uniref:hypothetical protein n=1 Tax=uncultured Clostridium sp. TaxID=59620 RepID=UPI0028EFD344|nr:hypothetical protein [uncultured Clostridium sp.]